MNNHSCAQIEHLFNLDNQRYIIIGGIPGVGKSTVVNEFKNNGYMVVCPDAIRFELAKNDHGADKLEGELTDYLQKYSREAFEIANNKVKKYLANGKSVIFDATNTTSKRRINLLRLASKIDVEKIAIYLECPLDVALDRNIKRSQTIMGLNKNGDPVYGRYVPQQYIKLKHLTQCLPTIREGYDSIYILHDKLRRDIKKQDPISLFEALKNSDDLELTIKEMYANKQLQELFPSLHHCWMIDQENENHCYDLHMHMIKTAQYLQNESLELFIAALLHDIGKIETKKFHGKLLFDTRFFKKGDKIEFKRVQAPIGENDIFIKVSNFDFRVDEVSELLTIKHIEIDKNAHYYYHNTVGAIKARRELIELGVDDSFAQKVYEYILYHMDLPFHDFSIKQIRKLENKLGVDTMNAMLQLRIADIKASTEDVLMQNKQISKIDLIGQYLKYN